MNINYLGWNNYFQEQIKNNKNSDNLPARVTAEYRGQYLVQTESAELQAEVSGALRYNCETASAFPKVGDWVIITRYAENKALIHQILPRQNILSRKKSGTIFEEQVFAANVSVICVIMGLDHDYNLRRLERYIALAGSLTARLLVILNKADLVLPENIPLSEVKKCLNQQALLITSALDHHDLEKIRQFFKPGDTAVFLGSSGAGKSTIINGLCGKDIQKTFAVREDDSRGRHTTTTRQLFVIEPGFCVIDTPGIRELQLWTEEQTIDTGFGDIAELAESCRFKNCQHQSEPGCAVQEALQSGKLDPARWENYLKLRKEQAYLETKVDEQAFLKRKEQDRKLHKLIRKVLDHKYGEH